MKIVVLNGSPRPEGHTAQMVAAFKDGAESAGHIVNVANVAQMNIAGCTNCNYCMDHDGKCVQDDDMQQIYPLLLDADMLVLASPIYYYFMTSQIWAAVNRFFCIGAGSVGNIKKSALLLTSGSPNEFGGAIEVYNGTIVGYLGMESMGIFGANETEDDYNKFYAEIKEFGAGLSELG